jgi:hypothetical protein
MKKMKNRTSELMNQMVISTKGTIKRLNTQSIIKLYPELRELVKVL